MPIPVGFYLSGIVNKIGPGGSYFKYARVVLIVLGLLFLGLIGAIAFPYVKNLIIKPTPTPTTSLLNIPRPTILPLPKGFQSWKFSYGNGVKGPKIDVATVDTLSPRPGSTQTLSLTVKNDTPVVKAVATVVTDSKNESHLLTLQKGDSKDGTWIGIWKIDDTYNYIYHIDLELYSASGNWSGALSFR